MYEMGRVSIPPLRTLSSDSLRGVTLGVDLERISGSGSVNVESNFDSKEMLTGISGSGDIRFRGGKAGRHEIRISGSGNVKSESLEADDVTVRVSGSGNATVFAKKTLNAQISGSGDVYYKGTPSITKSIRGSGSLVQR
jgi:hypothetical protein